MNIKLLSGTYTVRRLSGEDIDIIYDLSCKNEIFYKYHPPFVTAESIKEDMEILPPGKDDKDKYYVGFFDEETLVAVMDFVLGYPTEDTAYIGLFMMNLAYQKKGLGTKIISECAGYLKTLGFHKIRLAVDKGNPQSNAFWKKNGFIVDKVGEYIIMERIL